MNEPKTSAAWMANALATALAAGMLWACSGDDYADGGQSVQTSPYICFGLTDPHAGATRSSVGSAGDSRTDGRFVLRAEGAPDTLCVRTIVSEGIDANGYGEPAHPMRGLPVTQESFERFHVLAYRQTDGEAAVNRFFLDEEAVRNGTVWTTERLYYWPGANHAFRFYAWAPADLTADVLTTPANPTQTALTYRVPDDATAQPDLVVATTDEIAGNYNAAVPLTFRHVCTAVRFAVGSRMQPGTIRSVAIKGVCHKGAYDMAAGSWTLDESTTTFSQTLEKAMDGSETGGTGITTDTGTFMMLPQTLPAGAEVEVVFVNSQGESRTLTASIAGAEWKMGTTVTYLLTITPDYELDFVSEPVAQDAHYVVWPITIKADDNLPAGGWTLTSTDPDHVTFVESGKFVHTDVQAIVDYGYWLDDAKGASTLTGTTTGQVKVYVFIRENATDADRDITLMLKPAAEGNYPTKTLSFTQYCPAWNGTLGVERIQDQDYAWGFNWDNTMKITYDLGTGLSPLLVGIYMRWFAGYNYVSVSGSGIFSNLKVTIDFNKVPALTAGTDADNGLQNTWDIYTFQGVNEASALMAQLESWGGKPDKTLPTNPTEFAARACAMKNRYTLQTETNAGTTVYRPVLAQEDMVWYLPAQNEAPLMSDNLQGDYWTSTAITDPGTTAYKYTVGGITSADDRNRVIHVRAVRRHP